MPHSISDKISNSSFSTNRVELQKGVQKAGSYWTP